MCDQRSTKNKVRTIFWKNTFLYRKLVFPKLVFENKKEKHVELFSKTLGDRNEMCVCVSISGASNLYHFGFNKDFKSYLKYENKTQILYIVFTYNLDP